MVLVRRIQKAVRHIAGLRPNNSFKPKPLRYSKVMAGKACHAFASTTRFGLTQALGRMKVKYLSLFSLAIIAIASGITTQYPDPYHPSEAASAILVVLFALAIFAWFRADAIQRAYRRSPFLNVAVFGLAAVALPYYFVRSRGWKQGLIAILGAVGVLIAVSLISGLSAVATAWVQYA